MTHLLIYILAVLIICVAIIVINNNLKNNEYRYDAYGDALLVRKVLMVGMFIPFVNYILVCMILLCVISKILETLNERIKNEN